MADRAAHLTDAVLPDVPTLTFPPPLRYLLVYNTSVVSDVGVFVETADGAAEWRGLPEPNKGEVAAIAWDICMRVSRALKRRGLSLAGEEGDIDELAEREPLLAACYAAALRGFVATGHRAG